MDAVTLLKQWAGGRLVAGHVGSRRAPLVMTCTVPFVPPCPRSPRHNEHTRGTWLGTYKEGLGITACESHAQFNLVYVCVSVIPG